MAAVALIQRSYSIVVGKCVGVRARRWRAPLRKEIRM
jgi:hypothetical protein